MDDKPPAAKPPQTSPPPDPAAPDPKAQREARRAAALRDNLRRRKAPPKTLG